MSCECAYALAKALADKSTDKLANEFSGSEGGALMEYKKQASKDIIQSTQTFSLHIQQP